MGLTEVGYKAGRSISVLEGNDQLEHLMRDGWKQPSRDL